MARFLSPDDGEGQNASDPQSWNLYSYVQNNPLINTDPDGHDCVNASNAANGSILVQSTNDSSACLSGFTYVNGTVDPNSVTYNGETGDVNFNISNYADGSGISGSVDLGAPASFNESMMYNTFGPPSASTWNNASGAVNAMGGALLTGASVVAPELLLEDTGLLSLGLEAGDGDTYVIGKVADLDKGLQPGEKKLDLPDQGNPKANWAQNSSKLRQAMNEGKPIRDVSAGNPGSNTGFLRAERNLLQNHGWTLKGEYWVPPGR